MKTGKAVLVFLVLSSFLLASYNPPGALQTKYETGRLESEKTEVKTEADTRMVGGDNIARRLLLEQNRREKQGDLYVPLPAGPRVFDTSVVEAKGIYVTGNTAGHSGRFRELLHLVETTELNSMVIDVKNDHGRLNYPSNIEFVNEIGADNSPPVSNLRALVSELNNRGIYTIARLVVFRDPYLSKAKPGWAIQDSSGESWYDGSGKAWMNPYQEDLWRYNIAIAREAALLGFDEIQFDYVRFPALSAEKRKNLRLPGKNGRSRDEVIAAFLKFANRKLEDYRVKISADLFGISTSRWEEANNIGQSWEKIAPHVDYKSPMIYPSHYQSGYFNFKIPDANPAGTVKKALQAALEKNKKIENPAKLRPWLQGFTAHWLTGNINYGPQQIREQIEATRELGIDEYLIWNSSNRYNRNAFIGPEARRSEATGESSSPEG